MEEQLFSIEEDQGQGQHNNEAEDGNVLELDIKLEGDIDMEFDEITEDEDTKNSYGDDPEDSESDPLALPLTFTYSKMFINCIFCYNILQLPGSVSRLRLRDGYGSESDEDEDEYRLTARDLDDRYFDIIGKYLKVSLGESYSNFLEKEDLPSSTSPFCSSCLTAMESLQRLDDKLQLIQTQIATSVQYLTSSILQSQDKELGLVSKSSPTPEIDLTSFKPEPFRQTVAAANAYTDLRKKVLGRFCPKVLLIPLEKEQEQKRQPKPRLTKKRKRTPSLKKPVKVRPVTDPDVEAPTHDDSTTYAISDMDDFHGAESDGKSDSDAEFKPLGRDIPKPVKLEPPTPIVNSSYTQRLRRRKTCDPEFITVEPEIFIKEEAPSDPEPDEILSDVNFSSGNENADESDSEFELRKRKSKRRSPTARTKSSTRTRRSPTKKRKRTKPRKVYIHPDKRIMQKYQVVTDDDGRHFCGDIELIPVAGGFKCSKCKDDNVTIFGSLFKGRAHAVSHFRNIQCEVCGKNFSSRNVLRKHRQGVHDKRWSTVCDICDRPFKTTKAMIAHKWYHQSQAEIAEAIVSGVVPPPPPSYRNTVGIYPCELCGSVLKSKGSLFKHVKNHAAARNSTCGTCGKVFTTNGLRDHKRYCHVTIATHRIWHCHICEKPYNTKDNLRRHHNSVHKDNTVLCEVCQKPMKGSKGLPTHIWTHKSEEEKAEHIAAGLKVPVTGKEHYKKQVGEFPCNLCPKILTSKGALVKHLHRHVDISEGNSHLCPDCGKMFPTVEDVKSHQRYIHVVVDDRKHYVCKTCGMRFAVESRMRLHEMTHTGEKPFRCHLCPKAFRRAHPLKKHIEAHENGGEDAGGVRLTRPRSNVSAKPRRSRPKGPTVPEIVQHLSTSNSSEYQASEPIPHSSISSYHQHSSSALVLQSHMNYQHPPHASNVPAPYDPLNYTTSYAYQGGLNTINNMHII